MTHYVHDDAYLYRPEHPYQGDFEISHVTDHHYVPVHDTYAIAGGFNHDVDKHGGVGMMASIEHSFDKLFQDLEHETMHGVEHTDIH